MGKSLFVVIWMTFSGSAKGQKGTRGASVSLPLWHFLRPSVLMALAVHGAVGASGPAGGLPLFLLPDQAPDDQRYDDDQSHTNQNGAYILVDPLQHGNSLLFKNTWKMLEHRPDRAAWVPSPEGDGTAGLAYRCEKMDRLLTPWR